MTTPPSFSALQDVEFLSPEQTPNDYGKWLIHGPQGSGKTLLASTIAELGPTLFVDLTGERGIRSIQGAPYVKNITFARPSSITALDDLYWQLAKGGHPFKAVVIDSLTSVQKMAMRFILGHDETAVKEIRRGTAPADQRSWGQTLDIMTDLATFWYGLAEGQRPSPMHVVMTAQSKVTENEVSGELRYAPDVQKGSMSVVLAVPDYIVYTDVIDNPDALGDETAPPAVHVVRFGAIPEYRAKARVPRQLWGKIPPVLGTKQQTSLGQLSRVLGIGGAQRTTPATPASKKVAPDAAPAAADSTT